MGNNPSKHIHCGSECPVETVSWFDALAFANAMSRQDGLAECFELSDCTGAPGEEFLCATVEILAPEGILYDCEGYRLPTEAEWEYAARAGSQTAFFNGDISVEGSEPIDPVLDRAGWYRGNTLASYDGCTMLPPEEGARCVGPQPVGLKRANEFGLFDMHGNVFEIVWDNFLGQPSMFLNDTDPFLPATGDLLSEFGNFYKPVRRGGAYARLASDCRSAARNFEAIDTKGGDKGFRLVKTIH